MLELRKKVAQEQQEEVTKAKKEEQLAQHRKQALKDEIDIIKQDLENAQRLKVDLSKFLQDNAKAMMKAYEEENKVPDQQAADLHVKHASVLQMQLQKGNGYLAKAQEFYKMINKILSMLLKTEAQVPIVAQSLPLDALKTRMLEDYSRHDPSKYESIKEDELNCYENFEITTEWGSDQEDNEGHKSEENAANGVSNRAEYFNYMKNFKWEDKDVTSFDSSKFLVAVMTQALELDAVGMRQLIAIFEANTFEAVMENVGQSITDPSLEVLTLQNLTKKLKILFNNNLRISEGQLKK